jgi:hypothetical protein
MLLDLTLIGLVVTLEPLPITGYIAVLSAKGGLRKGLIFILAWLATLVAVIALTLAVTGGKPPETSSAPTTGLLIAKLVIGAGLVAFGVHKRQAEPKPPKEPKWKERIDDLAWWKVASLGLLLQPWPVVAAGAATVAQAKLTSFESYLTLMYFCLLSTASLLTMELYAAARPESTKAKLNALTGWVNTHRDQAIVYLSLILGLWLVGKSIFQLV